MLKLVVHIETTVYSQIHTKHINTLCGQNVEFLYVKPGGTYSNHCLFSDPHKTHNTLCGQNVDFIHSIPGGTYSYHGVSVG
jgi:hypothetical protein